MNHVLFVDPTRGAEVAFGFGVNAMELLLNGLFRLGAQKSNLRAKVFGGAQMIGRTSEAGQKNVKFVTEFLVAEGLTIEGGDTGGTNARRLEFWPGLGRARVKLVLDMRVEEIPTPRPLSSSEPELF
ncbi:chemotaxis protein CheD [uncultured Maritimibacter sp.]|uniref:chemotaxis protein CheD n=1 Tax=uncultured Maritimibacter sp. TaxID=991866 RepID=UPI00262AA0AE|nr:chemotaxis protein CheD [uncultured Maritimibacter sp.]